MAYPQIKVEEVKTPVAAVASRSYARLGSVGLSNRGKFNQQITLTKSADIDNKVGRDTKQGSVGVQAAWDEGGQDQIFFRVLGNGVAASAEVVCNTMAVNDPPTTLTITPVGGSAIVYTATLSGTNVNTAAQLIALVNNDQNCPVFAAADASIPGGLIMTAKAVGMTSNAVTYALSQLLNNKAQNGNLANGADGPALAQERAVQTAAIAAVQATGTITITDVQAAAGIQTVKVGNTNYSSLASDNTGAKACTTIANAIQADVNAVATAVEAAIAGGATITLTAKAVGTTGNAVTFQPPGGAVQNFAGGANAVAAVYYDILLVSVFEGANSNAIKRKYIPGATPGTLILQLFYNNPTTPDETWNLTFTAADLINGTELAALRASNLVRGFFLGNVAAPNLPVGSTAYLSGGGDGPIVTTNDYIAALRNLGKANCNIIFAPYQSNDFVRHALLSQAENATILGGLRVAILNAPKGLTADGAPTATLGYDTNTGSATMVAGWATYAGQPSLPELSVSPDCFYAGHLAATKLYISPSARTSSPFFSSVVDTDMPKMDEVAFSTFTDSRLEGIIMDPQSGGWHCLNGRTLSSDSAEYYMCVRRQANKIRTDIYFGSQKMKSEPRGAVRSAISNFVTFYFKGLTAVGEITGGTLDAINQIGAKFQVDVTWGPQYPVDEIDYGLHRIPISV